MEEWVQPNESVAAAGMALNPVILSEAEEFFANWMRSLHYGRDDRVGAAEWKSGCGRMEEWVRPNGRVGAAE